MSQRAKKSTNNKKTKKKKKFSMKRLRKEQPILFWIIVPIFFIIAFIASLFENPKTKKIAKYGTIGFVCLILMISVVGAFTDKQVKTIDLTTSQNTEEKEEEVVTRTEPVKEEQVEEESKTEESKTEQTKTEKETPKSSNLLMNCDVHKEEMDNGKQRAYVQISEEDYENIDDEDIAEFALKKVNAAKTKGISSFAILIEDGGGIVFPGCNYKEALYGNLDENGDIDDVIRYIYITEDGDISFEEQDRKASVQDEDEEVMLDEGVDEEDEDDFTVYIPKTGNKMHLNPNCGNMNDPRQSTYLKEKSRYEPCSTCFN